LDRKGAAAAGKSVADAVIFRQACFQRSHATAVIPPPRTVAPGRLQRLPNRLVRNWPVRRALWPNRRAAQHGRNIVVAQKRFHHPSTQPPRRFGEGAEKHSPSKGTASS